MGRVARIIGTLLRNEWLSNGLPRLLKSATRPFPAEQCRTKICTRSIRFLSALDTRCSRSPPPGTSVAAAEALYHRDCVLAVTRRFFFDAFAQGAKLLLGDPVNLGRNFHDGHGKKLCRKVQMQFVREANMLLERPCH